MANVVMSEISPDGFRAVSQAAAMVEMPDHVSGADAMKPERTPKPIDLVHLAKHTLGDRTLEREILALFRVQSNGYMKRLNPSSQDRHWRTAAHTVKGSARSIGAWRLADIAEDAELVEPSRDPGATVKALLALEGEIGKVNAYIDTLLDEV